jgi:hypothetical protein
VAVWGSVVVGLTVAILVGAAFVGGCFCGSWVQRSIGYIIRTRAEKELLDQAAERVERTVKEGRGEDYAKRRIRDAAEALANFGEAPHGSDHPLGHGLPSPGDLDDLDDLLDAEARSNPNDFTAGLATERMKSMRGRANGRSEGG